MKEKITKMIPIIALSFSIVSILLIIAEFTDFNFKIGNFEFSAGKSDRQMFEAVLVRYKTIPDEQRSYLNDKVNQMVTLIMDHHVKLLSRHGVTSNYLSCDQYRHYATIVENALTKMKIDSLSRFDFMIEGLRFNSKNKPEFVEYAKNTAMEYITAVGNIIQEKWIDLGVSKEENFEWTRSLIPQINSMIIDVYDHAYNIQIKYEAKLKLLGGV